PEPALRLAGACRPHSQPPGPHRPPARYFRAAGTRQRVGIRRRLGPAGLSAGGASRTFRTAANAAVDDRDGLHRSGRTMAAGELLMTHQDFTPRFTNRPMAVRSDLAAS